MALDRCTDDRGMEYAGVDTVMIFSNFVVLQVDPLHSDPDPLPLCDSRSLSLRYIRTLYSLALLFGHSYHCPCPRHPFILMQNLAHLVFSSFVFIRYKM